MVISNPYRIPVRIRQGVSDFYGYHPVPDPVVPQQCIAQRLPAWRAWGTF